jgi:exoribonuclease R
MMLSLKLENGNYEIIHIADVSHYLQEGTLDDEAYQEQTSVYLVDRVVPCYPKYYQILRSLRQMKKNIRFRPY